MTFQTNPHVHRHPSSLDFPMAGRGRRRQVHRGSSSQYPPATPDAPRTRPLVDEFIDAEDAGLSPPTRSSVGGATPSPGLPSASTPIATTATASTPTFTPAATPPVAPTRTNPYPGLLVEHGVYIRRPGFADPPTLPELPANIDRTELWADGATFFSTRAGADLGDVMRENFHGPYINFSDVPLDRRFIWLDMMQKKYWWPDHRESAIRKCYKTVASKSFRDMINDQKALTIHSGDLRKDWLKAEFWKKMKEKIEESAYKAKCEKARESRAKGGLHTGGSIPTVEHFRRMYEEALRAGGDPKTTDFSAIFQRTHKRKKDGKLVDERAAKVYMVIVYEEHHLDKEFGHGSRPLLGCGYADHIINCARLHLSA